MVLDCSAPTTTRAARLATVLFALVLVTCDSPTDGDGRNDQEEASESNRGGSEEQPEGSDGKQNGEGGSSEEGSFTSPSASLGPIFTGCPPATAHTASDSLVMEVHFGCERWPPDGIVITNRGDAVANQLTLEVAIQNEEVLVAPASSLPVPSPSADPTLPPEGPTTPTSEQRTSLTVTTSSGSCARNGTNIVTCSVEGLGVGDMVAFSIAYQRGPSVFKAMFSVGITFQASLN